MEKLKKLILTLTKVYKNTRYFDICEVAEESEICSGVDCLACPVRSEITYLQFLEDNKCF